MLDFSGIPLGSTYKRYKLGTTKLTNWMRETAGEDLHATELKTADLLRLAQAISNARPKATVPITILLCVNDVIQGRTLCASFYKQLEDAGTASGKTNVRNKSHQYFISVLEEIQRHLKGLKVECAGKPSDLPQKSKASSGKKPTFDILELEEPSDLMNATPAVPLTKEGSGEPDRNALDEEAEMEALFAIFCAFQDMRDIRLHIQAVWRKYYSGKISYLVATEITLAGFKLTRGIDDGLFADYPWIDTYDDISDFLGLESSHVGENSAFFMNNLSQVLPTGRGGALRGGETVKPDELFCALAANVLNDFRIYCRSTREPDNPHFQVRLSNHPLTTTLRQIEPTIRFMADHMRADGFGVTSVHGFLIDILTGSLITTSKLGAFPIWAVANCQILVDILEALGNKPQVGFDILQDSLARSSKSARIETLSNLVNRAEPPASLSPQAYDNALAMPAAIKQAHAKLVSNSKVNNKHGRLDGQPMELTGTFAWPSDRHPEQLLPALPVLSGFRLRDLAFGRCLGVLQKANRYPCILALAYAYRAAQTFGVIQGSWTDMDTVINSQVAHGAPYVLEASSLEGYARNFDVAIGATPVSSTTRRPRVPDTSTIASKMRKLMPPSSYMLATQEAEITADNGREEFYEALYLTAQRVYNTDHHTSLTPPELLNALQKSLLEDEVYLRFNYDTFSMRCHALLSTANYTEAERQDFLSRAPKVLASGGNMDQLAQQSTNVKIVETVHEALWEAAEYQKRGGTMNGPSKLARISGSIQGIINHDPEAFLSAARHGSSGHIATSDAPRCLWEWGGKPKVVFGPETPKEAEKRIEDDKVNSILNAACAKFREWNSEKRYKAEDIARVKPWTEKKLAEAGLSHLAVGEVKIIPEFKQITIPVGLKWIVEELAGVFPCRPRRF